MYLKICPEGGCRIPNNKLITGGQMGFYGSGGEGEPEAGHGVKSVWNLLSREWD